jgi:hypothetical protein
MPLIFVKIFLVAFAVFGQAKLFEEKPAAAASVESGLDSVYLPAEKPELVLAKRAMEAHGLCPGPERNASASAVGNDDQADEDSDSSRNIATLCF